MRQPRWFFLTFTLLILLSLMHAKWKSLHKLMQQERNFQIALQQALQLQAKQSSTTDRLSHENVASQAVYETVGLAMKNGLFIKQWHILDVKSQISNMKMVEIESLGEFQQQLVFLYQLSRVSESTFIQTLDWQLQQDSLLLLRLKYAWLPALNSDRHFADARLAHVHADQLFRKNILPSKDSLLHKHDYDISVSALHFSGSWLDAGQQFALIEWPDHCGRMVVLQEHIGLEHAVVVAIEHDHVVFALPSKNQVVSLWS